MSEEFVIEGTLDKTTLPELLQAVYKGSETGELSFSFLDTEKTIHLQNGKIIFASSNDPDDRLGECLLREGKITVAQYQESAERLGSGKKQGEILCDLGYLMPDELVQGVKNQVKRIIFSLFRWTKGEYELDLKELDIKDLITLNISTEEIIMKGIESIDKWTRVYQAVGDLDTSFQKTPESEAIINNMSLSEDEIHLFNAISGTLDVEQICSISYLDNFATYKVLWAFKSIGAIEEAESEPRKRTAQSPGGDEFEIKELVDTYNKVFGYVYQSFNERDGEDADEIFHHCLEEIRDHHSVVFEGITFPTGGLLDFDQIYNNLVSKPEEKRAEILKDAFNELVYKLIFFVKNNLSKEIESELVKKIKEIREEVE